MKGVNGCYMSEILPKMNLKWYKGDVYSDGDIEDVIINIIDSTKGQDYGEAVTNNFSWPTYYHLSDLRKNILNWYSFKEDSSVLEIGCGMGAITPVLCDKCKDVTAVELSKRRATATQHRCRNKSNLEIIVGNLNDIEFEKKFDYITLIGVLEYQAHYTQSNDPFLDFLIKVKALLKHNGKLLIAIENKYGLKYWCGTPEDHTSAPFDGMNQYKIGNRVAKTFSREELKDLVERSGFEYNKFYYPMPDYKFPNYIYTDAYLPKIEQLREARPYYLYQDSVIADEQDMYRDLLENNVFPFFANSFFVECSLDKEFDNAIFVATSNARKPEYQMQTIIHMDDVVHKKALEPEALEHIKRICENSDELKERGIKVINSKYENGMQIMECVKLPTLEQKILEYAKAKDKDKILESLRLLYKSILSSSEHVDSRETYFHQIGIIDSEVNMGVILKKGYTDMIDRNCFVDDADLVFFDQEYSFPNIPASYIIFRSISLLYAFNPWVEEACPLMLLLDEFGCSKHIDVFGKFEKYFREKVINTAAYNQYNYFRKAIDFGKNIKKLLSTSDEETVLKAHINSFIAKKDFVGLYQFFIDNKLESMQDSDIVDLQKILETYGIESSQNIQFSFGEIDNLKNMIKKYYEMVSLLKLYIKYFDNNEIRETLSKEIKFSNMSIYVFLVIIQCEFPNEDEDLFIQRISECFKKKA